MLNARGIFLTLVLCKHWYVPILLRTSHLLTYGIQKNSAQEVSDALHDNLVI